LISFKKFNSTYLFYNTHAVAVTTAAEMIPPLTEIMPMLLMPPLLMVAVDDAAVDDTTAHRN
jgi:hypothetical protein